MTETFKTISTWSDFEISLIRGKVIDIGCGSDPISPTAICFDIDDGDANKITSYVHETFDVVYSSHCLEHMEDARIALEEWWKLVIPGGHLILIVPDEDLYEQGSFPSKFNKDHKWTFTISKSKSWSPVSINLFELVSKLPGAQIISISLQDTGYNRKLYKHGEYNFIQSSFELFYNIYRRLRRRKHHSFSLIEQLRYAFLKIDQTDPDFFPCTLAQIQVIVKKSQTFYPA